MERRKFVVGLGSLAAGGAAAMGTGAFSRVSSERTMSVQAVKDDDAYLGLKETDSPNESYVDFDDDNHLRIRLDGDNKTEGGGIGVNSDSTTVVKDLFKIVNQGKQKIHLFVYKIGPNPGRAALFISDASTPCWDYTLDVGDSINIGLLTYTHGLKAKEDGTQLLNQLYICAVGKENPDDDEYEGTAEGMVPDDAEPNDEIPGDD